MVKWAAVWLTERAEDRTESARRGILLSRDNFCKESADDSLAHVRPFFADDYLVRLGRGRAHSNANLQV